MAEPGRDDLLQALYDLVQWALDHGAKPDEDEAVRNAMELVIHTKHEGEASGRGAIRLVRDEPDG